MRRVIRSCALWNSDSTQRGSSAPVLNHGMSMRIVSSVIMVSVISVILPRDVGYTRVRKTLSVGIRLPWKVDFAL